MLIYDEVGISKGSACLSLALSNWDKCCLGIYEAKSLDRLGMKNATIMNLTNAICRHNIIMRSDHINHLDQCVVLGA